MSDDRTKHTLLTLIRLAREQHKQIDALTVAVTAIRSCLTPADDKKIDEHLRRNVSQVLQSGQSDDETIRLLDRIEEQIRKS